MRAKIAGLFYEWDNKPEPKGYYELIDPIHELYMDWFKEEVEKLGLIEGLENEYIPEDAAYDQLVQDKQILCSLLEKSKWEKSK